MSDRLRVFVGSAGCFKGKSIGSVGFMVGVVGASVML